MSEPASISAGIADRYATAVFEISKDSGQLDTLKAEVDALEAALAESADLQDLINSPIYTRDQQDAAIEAIGKSMGLSATMIHTLGLMAQKRRLFILPALLRALSAMIAEAKGEVTADVTSATELSQEQQAKLADALAAKTGKTVKLNIAVDETLIGGMIVKLGSRMVDTSIRSQLASLQNSMKEVG
ncbi:F0F1 ATP synthase subunit delta [Thioclava sp. GXIMD4216]|uniref:ATP synthase subunit delta n=1 Tax=Thioclava litoralis TaxID=3076557 RepID=A0ABZ1DYC3_9RHOB|nr:F0F1 ATP synthase subunit delta [Thioclava sp. FTW29]